MTTCEEVIKYYRKLPGETLNQLWDSIHKKGPNIDQLRDILLYCIHKKLPAPSQHYVIDILPKFSGKVLSRKARNLMNQILEENCSCLENNILETAYLSPNMNLKIDLLNSILVGGFISLVDNVLLEQLVSLLQSRELQAEHRGKLLLFLCQRKFNNSSALPVGYVCKINKFFIELLQDRIFYGNISKPSFRRQESISQTEVDGTTAGNVHTILTLRNTTNEHAVMEMYVFGLINIWLEVSGCIDQELKSVIYSYCTAVVEQSFRTALARQDLILQKTVLCEVLHIIDKLVKTDKNLATESMMLGKRIYSHVGDTFKNDHRYISILIRVLSLLLNVGDLTGYDCYRFCEQLFGEIVYQSYTSDIAAIEILLFINKNKLKLMSFQQNLLQKYFPNLLKFISWHPHNLTEDFIKIIPTFTGPGTNIEVLHSILDLPVLSATLLLHQSTAVLSADKIVSSYWTQLITDVRSPASRSTFSYLMRQESQQGLLPGQLTTYFKVVQKLSSHPLVLTCSQVTPLLLDTFFSTVKSSDDENEIASIVKALIGRISLLFNVSEYADTIHSCFLAFLKETFKTCPKLVFTLQTTLVEYISSSENYDVCNVLYTYIVWCIGQYTLPTHLEQSTHNVLLQYYEVLECVLYEMLSLLYTDVEMNIKLLNIICSALAKLASRSEDIIPRVLLCLAKAKTQLMTLQQVNTKNQIGIDRIDELTAILNDPNVARAVLSTSETESKVMSEAVRVLVKFME